MLSQDSGRICHITSRKAVHRALILMALLFRSLPRSVKLLIQQFLILYIYFFRLNLAPINDSDVGLKTDLVTINPSQLSAE